MDTGQAPKRLRAGPDKKIQDGLLPAKKVLILTFSAIHFISHSSYPSIHSGYVYSLVRRIHTGFWITSLLVHGSLPC